MGRLVAVAPCGRLFLVSLVEVILALATGAPAPGMLGPLGGGPMFPSYGTPQEGLVHALGLALAVAVSTYGAVRLWTS